VSGRVTLFADRLVSGFGSYLAVLRVNH